MIDLSGKHVLVTGAGGGIGRVLCASFGAAGATVSAFDRSGDMLEGLGVAFGSAFDIRDERAAAVAVERLVAAVGVPDVLVNNAGWTRAETLDAVDETVWRAEVDLNLNGTYYVTHPVLKGMVERGSGVVLFIASVNALADFGNPAYSAAKAGMLALCRSIAVEYGGRGIRANAICPGSVRTPAWEHRIERDPGVVAEAVRFYPMGRFVEPQEVANAALFLASPLASGVTGAVLPVDAGLTAGNLPFIRDIILRGSPE
jgi:NAD(P)-dependent dehydrogenase (short-subunit alcohol dehydrogenase family)